MSESAHARDADALRRRIEDARRRSREGGGPERVTSHRAGGRLTARERIDVLLDEGSFVEVDAFVEHRSHDFGMEKHRVPGDGVVTGSGTIDGRDVLVFSQDFTVFGGSLSEANAEKILKVLDLALRLGVPVIGLNDSGGARIQEGVASLGGYAEIFLRNTIASGVVPQISAILGPCAGGAVYSPALTDFVFMVEGSSTMYVTGPDVVRAVTHEEVGHAELGGAAVHAEKSGVCHFVAPDDATCLSRVRDLVSYLPSNNREPPPRIAPSDPPERECPVLDGFVPDDPGRPYDMAAVVREIVDRDTFFPVHERFARNIIVGFARLAGEVIGIIANQPLHLAGTLDSDASVKAARFIRFSDAFGIPIITFVDVPGFLPGTSQEHGGIIRHGAKLLFAYCEATVPKITIITRKAYGGAYDVMGSKHIRGDLNLAWPTAEIAVMGAEGAVAILHRRALKEAADPEALRARLVAEYRAQFANPLIAASRGWVDDIIEPRRTRVRLAHALRLLRSKRQVLPPKKHGNLPL